MVLKLTDLFSIEALEYNIEKGYVKRKKNKWYPHLFILNYTREAEYGQKWNDVTKSCRGLIYNGETMEIVAHPFKKFFNLEEHLERDFLQNEDKFYMDGSSIKEPDGVFEKHDGSLGIMYRAGNRILWSTRGDFHSTQAEVANRVWQEKYAHLDDILLNVFKDFTLLVEIISPETRVVRNYGMKEDLILLGIKSIDDKNFDASLSLMKIFTMPHNLMCAEEYRYSLEKVIYLQKTIPANEEGFILRYGNERVKVKGDKYKKVFSLMYGLSNKKKIEYCLTGQANELIKELGNEFKREIVDLNNAVQMVRSEIGYIVNLEYDNIIRQIKKQGLELNRKVFSRFVQQSIVSQYGRMAYKLFDKKPIDKEIELYMMKNVNVVYEQAKQKIKGGK